MAYWTRSGRGDGAHHCAEYVMREVKVGRFFPRLGPTPVLAICLAAFLLQRVLEGVGQSPDWASSYLDDLLCLPLVLSLILLIRRRVVRGHDVLPIGHSLFALVVFSLYFEILLPLLSDRYTADPWDVVMYLAGWFIFNFWINRAGSPAGEHSSALSPISSLFNGSGSEPA